MSSPFNSKSFRDLQTKWYKRLEKKGFQDIERTSGALKLNHADYFADKRRYSPEMVMGKQNYYRLACEFVHIHEFNTRTEKAIWELHAEGHSDRDITKMLKNKRARIYRTRVQDIIKSLEIQMITKMTGKAPK